MSCDDHSCGTGGWGGPKPGDPSNNSILSATPAFGGIDLNWSFPTVNPFAVAHTRIFRGIIADFAGATIIVEAAGGSFYFDPLPYDNVEYFYWIQFVSINGTYGDVIGPASARSKDSIANTIEQLTGKIDASVLAQALKAQIALIPEIDDKLFQEIEDRLAGNVSLSNALAQVQDVSDATLVQVQQEITQRIDANAAMVASINSLFAQTAGNAAAINDEKTVRASKDDALASQISSVSAAMGPAIAAAILTEQTARVNADGALATDVSTLYTRTSNNAAAIITEQTARTNADSALSTSVTDLYAKASSNLSAIQSEQTARANADSALASDITVLYTKANGNTAAITVEQNARIDQGVALTNSITAMRTTIGGDISAAVATETNARVAADSALSSQITTAQSTLNGSISSVQTSMQTQINTANGKITNIGALYTVKLNVNGLIGGFGTYNDGTTVTMGFDVDAFWIGRTSENFRKPFILSGGVVYIDDLAINKLTFDKLRASDGSLIVSGGKIQAAYIEVVDTIQSVGYVAGVSGWKITRSNDFAEFGNVKVRGDVQATSLTADTVNVNNLVSGSIGRESVYFNENGVAVSAPNVWSTLATMDFSTAGTRPVQGFVTFAARQTAGANGAEHRIRIRRTVAGVDSILYGGTNGTPITTGYDGTTISLAFVDASQSGAATATYTVELMLLFSDDRATFSNRCLTLRELSKSSSSVTVVAYTGGAVGGGASSGGGGGYGGCVAIASYLPGMGPSTAGDVKVGDYLQLADSVTLEPAMGEVTYSQIKTQPGYRITTESGVTLLCSDTAPIPTPDGLVLAPNLAGKQVPVRHDGANGLQVTGWETVVQVNFVGPIQVQHITVGDRCFWAGEQAGSYILHHNIKP